MVIDMEKMCGICDKNKATVTEIKNMQINLLCSLCHAKQIVVMTPVLKGHRRMVTYMEDICEICGKSQATIKDSDMPGHLNLLCSLCHCLKMHRDLKRIGELREEDCIDNAIFEWPTKEEKK